MLYRIFVQFSSHTGGKVKTLRTASKIDGKVPYCDERDIAFRHRSILNFSLAMKERLAHVEQSIDRSDTLRSKSQCLLRMIPGLAGTSPNSQPTIGLRYLVTRQDDRHQQHLRDHADGKPEVYGQCGQVKLQQQRAVRDDQDGSCDA